MQKGYLLHRGNTIYGLILLHHKQQAHFELALRGNAVQAVFVKAETFACVQLVILTLIVNDCFAFQCGQDGVAGGAVWGQADARIECHQHKLHVVCVDKVNISNAALFVRNQVFQGCGLASFDDVVQDRILLFKIISV